MDINILSIFDNGDINISIGESPYKVTGINKLLQKIVKILLTSPGEDLWNPGIGGGLKELVSKRVDRDNLSDMYGQVAIAIMNTERYLLQEQLSDEVIGDEKLKSLDLVSVKYDYSNNRWNVVVDVITSNGTKTSLILS